MPLSVEFFTLTGPVSDLILQYPPSTGPNGSFDVAVDPIGGPAQRGPSVVPADFGIIGSSVTGVLTYNLVGSDILGVRQNHIDSGVTGPVLRVVYNH